MPRRRALPALPRHLFSVLGPVPVTVEPGMDRETLGVTRFHHRSIGIDAQSGPETRWQTFGHEMTHVVLWDGGVTDLIDPKVEEAICNAMGTYIAAAVKAGYIKFTSPTTSE